MARYPRLLRLQAFHHAGVMRQRRGCFSPGLLDFSDACKGLVDEFQGKERLHKGS